jgi:hypothetical protein
MKRREQETEREVEIARYRAMEQAATDPLAARMLHEIVTALEAASVARASVWPTYFCV